MGGDVGFQCGERRGPVRDVEAENARGAARRFDGAACLIGARLVGAVMHCDRETIPRNAKRDGAADALARPGDEDAAFRLVGHVVSPGMSNEPSSGR